MTPSVLLLGAEAWINILLVTISGRDRGCLSVPPLLSPSLLSSPVLPPAHRGVQDPRWITGTMFIVCSEGAFFFFFFFCLGDAAAEKWRWMQIPFDSCCIWSLLNTVAYLNNTVPLWTVYYSWSPYMSLLVKQQHEPPPPPSTVSLTVSFPSSLLWATTQTAVLPLTFIA